MAQQDNDSPVGQFNHEKLLGELGVISSPIQSQNDVALSEQMGLPSEYSG